MADGDLETEVEISGRDEVAEMAGALEVFRQHALEVQRLNLVEQLANELQGKNRPVGKCARRLAECSRPDHHAGQARGAR